MVQSNELNRDARTLQLEGPLSGSPAFVLGISRARGVRLTRSRTETRLAFRNRFRCVREVRCLGRERHIRCGHNLPHDAQIGLTGVVRTL